MRPATHGHSMFSYETRRQILFNQLRPSERLYVRIKKEQTNRGKLNAAIAHRIAPVAKYYIEQIMAVPSTEASDYLFELPENIYFQPSILNALLDTHANSSAMSIHTKQTLLQIILDLYKRLCLKDPERLNHSIRTLITSAALMLHYGANLEALLKNTTNNQDDIESSYLAREFMTEIGHVHLSMDAFIVESQTPDAYFALSEEAKQRIYDYETGQFYRINYFNDIRQGASFLAGFFSACYGRLRDVCYQTSCFKEQDDMPNVPEKFICSISSRIMNEPVYDPNQSQYRFESTQIKKWLAIKQENPFTCTPLRVEALKLDEPLKQEIIQFKKTQPSRKYSLFSCCFFSQDNTSNEQTPLLESERYMYS